MLHIWYGYAPKIPSDLATSKPIFRQRHGNGLLCTAGMLNGVFGEGETRHIAHWGSVKFTDHWEEQEEDGTKILHDRERFSHELTLVFADGKTQMLTHEKRSPNDHQPFSSDDLQ